MTNYVLVHGAWHAGWAWDRVAPTLRREGHRVLIPDLPSASGTSLADHVAVVRDAIESLPAPVTVVAHSYAGVVAPQSVAATDPDHVEALVLVDGWVAAAGQSLLDVAPDWFEDWCRESAVGSGDRAVIPAPPASILGLEDEALVDFVESRMSAQPLRTFSDPATVTLEHPSTRRCAIACLPSMFPFADMAKEYGCEIREIESGHEVMLSRPLEFLDALRAFAALTH